MITDIPDSEDFEAFGVDYLNLAWEQALGLLKKLDLFEGDFDQDDYWKAAQRPLSTAVALTHQGIEFLLKAHIAAVSPFLLICRDVKSWPKQCDKQNKPFSSFYTIDAEDLVRVYNTTVDTRLSDAFLAHFTTIRELRNTLTHTVDLNVTVTAADVIRHILYFSEYLLGKKRWISLRKLYLEKDHDSVLYSSDLNHWFVVTEIRHVVELLTRAELIEIFDFDKKRRCYICPDCRVSADFEEINYKMAVLEPNTPASTQLYCFVCNKHFPVERKNCTLDKCKGNVIEDYVCLTCGGDQ
jgi:hypothetical protein